jgi:hypothetical protein
MAFVLSVSRHLTKAMQPIAGPRPARLCFMKTRPLQSMLALVSGG